MLYACTCIQIIPLQKSGIVKGPQKITHEVYITQTHIHTWHTLHRHMHAHACTHAHTISFTNTPHSCTLTSTETHTQQCMHIYYMHSHMNTHTRMHACIRTHPPKLHCTSTHYKHAHTTQTTCIYTAHAYTTIQSRQPLHNQWTSTGQMLGTTQGLKPCVTNPRIVTSRRSHR